MPIYRPGMQNENVKIEDGYDLLLHTHTHTH